MANVLGRGLDALLSGNTEEKKPVEASASTNSNEGVSSTIHRVSRSADEIRERPKESVFWIETAKITPNPNQPRKHFDEEKIRAMADSIRQYGILQPIVVTKQETDVPTGTQVEYQIIAGERRYRAAKLLGLSQMPAIIRREESEKIKLELALIENLQREDLNPLEKARAYRRLMDEFKLSAREVGLRVGKSREAISNTVRLLALPTYIQDALVQGRLVEGQVRPLITLANNPEVQRSLFQKILVEGMVARDIEYAANTITGRGRSALLPQRVAQKQAFDATARSFEARLAEELGTRVIVRRTSEGKGRISIDFFSDAEFQNILAHLAPPTDSAPREEPNSSFTI